MKEFLKWCFDVVLIAIGFIMIIAIGKLLIGISPIVFPILILGAIIYGAWKLIEFIWNSLIK